MPLMDNLQMGNELNAGDQTSPEVRLVEEVLAGPDFQHESKGTKTAAVIRFLLELYQQDPTAFAKEQDVSDAIYSHPAYTDETATRKAIGRARDWLNKHMGTRHPSQSLRVRIADGGYRLEFYNRYSRFGVDPLQWFWSRYLNHSELVGLGFMPPDDRQPQIYFNPNGEQKTFVPEDVLSLYTTAHKVLNRSELPSFMTKEDWDTYEFWDEEGGQVLEHKILFGLIPHRDFIGDSWQPSKYLPLVAFRDPTGKIQISDPAPPPDGPSVYVDTFDIGIVLVSRLTLPDPPHFQITTIAASSSELIRTIMQTLSTNEGLLSVVTLGALGNPELSRDAAPERFQLVFEVPDARRVSDFRSRGRPVPCEPHLRCAYVFRDVGVGISVLSRDSSLNPPLVMPQLHKWDTEHRIKLKAEKDFSLE
jgi:hypothetical protein